MEVINFLAAPFVMCLILVGIHCYLGLHVLARGVIFVDLALAQVAALGTTAALLYGFDHHDRESYFISLGFTLVAASFFAFANRAREKISQEAIIGIVYAFSSAAVVLLVDRLAHGAEHLKYALVGQLLWVTWEDVARVVGIYAGVSLIHYIFRKQFISHSFERKKSWFWDFLFYALFGVVITSSVHLAGVLLVFAFLIVPSIVSSFFYQSLRGRLVFGWLLGFVLCSAGMYFSYIWDLPSGAAIVVGFTVVPILLVAGSALRAR